MLFTVTGHRLSIVIIIVCVFLFFFFVQTPCDEHRASKGIKCVLFTAAFLGILLIPVTVFNDVPEQRNCAAILTFAGLMWATEVRMTD